MAARVAMVVSPCLRATTSACARIVSSSVLTVAIHLLFRLTMDMRPAEQTPTMLHAQTSPLSAAAADHLLVEAIIVPLSYCRISTMRQENSGVQEVFKSKVGLYVILISNKSFKSVLCLNRLLYLMFFVC